MTSLSHKSISTFNLILEESHLRQRKCLLVHHSDAVQKVRR